MQFWICERGVRKPSFEFLLLIWHRYYIDIYCLIALIGSVHFKIKTLSINDFLCECTAWCPTFYLLLDG